MKLQYFKFTLLNKNDRMLIFVWFDNLSTPIVYYYSVRFNGWRKSCIQEDRIIAYNNNRYAKYEAEINEEIEKEFFADIL